MYSKDIEERTNSSDRDVDPRGIRVVHHVQDQQIRYKQLIKSEFCNSYLA